MNMSLMRGRLNQKRFLVRGQGESGLGAWKPSPILTVLCRNPTRPGRLAARAPGAPLAPRSTALAARLKTEPPSPAESARVPVFTLGRSYGTVPLMKRRDFLERWGLSSLKINLGFLEGEFAPRDPDRAAA